ncbi:hypothetical protein [Saliphagus sp. LR7]|uniref:hypothetical protein n=1 Tax=Saliphagus sp. LR7 TaxID=2282654 RepID=UPI000DF830F7|nr:hypothetical protein [Saliphagus sp. LR7]
MADPSDGRYEPDDIARGLSRRRYLSATGVAAGLAGCLDRSSLPFGSNPAPAVVSDEVLVALLAGDVIALAEREGPQAVDPDETDRPVRDALEILADNGGGEVRLPPTAVVERGTIEPPSDTSIVGFGPTVSEITIAEPGIDGIRFTDPDGVARVRLDGFVLNGPGLETASGAAIRHAEGDTQDLSVGRLVLWGWTDAVYRVEEGVGPFQCRHDLLTVYECDAGNADGLFEFRSSYGPANWFGTVAVYPNAHQSGENSTILFTRGGTQRIDHLTMGGTAAPAIHQQRDAHLDVGHLHWEPVGLESTPEAIVRLEGYGPARIGSVKHVTGSGNYCYRLEYDPYTDALPARKALGVYYPTRPEATLAENVVALAAPNDPDLPSFYWGNADDVDVTHTDEGTGGFRAMGGAGTPVG